MRNQKTVDTLQTYLDLAKGGLNDVKIMQLDILVTAIKDEYIAKKGDFAVINEEVIVQCYEEVKVGDKVAFVMYDLAGCVESIREAHASEREAKIEEFKSRGYVCGDDGLWVEPKLEDVYCVAKSKVDFIRVYAVKPELVLETANMGNCHSKIQCLTGRGITNNNGVGNKKEVSIEKFIELIKKQK
jgi:hypothetical protein